MTKQVRHLRTSKNNKLFSAGQKHTSVEVVEVPKCDFCSSKAVYDGKTNLGPWANMCENHFSQYGVGLGLGKGQKLIKSKLFASGSKTFKVGETVSWWMGNYIRVGIIRKIKGDELTVQLATHVSIPHKQSVFNGDELIVKKSRVWK